MKYGELPTETQELTHSVIEASKHLSEPWKSSPEEPFAIRRFARNSSEDTQRFKDIDRHPIALKWMVQDKPSSNEDLDYLLNIDETDKEDPRMMWAVVNERNEPIGWVQFYKDEHLSEDMKKELGVEEDALILEVSYVKNFATWPKYSRFINDRDNLDTEHYGEGVTNGLKQTMLRIAEMEEFISKEANIPPRPIYIVGFTDPKNRPSQIVLTANKFKNVGMTDFDGEMDNTWIKKINS